MLSAEQLMTEAIAMVVYMTPIGTNAGLFRLLWVMVNGSFLQSRGAIFPALWLNGFPAETIRRSWSALAKGSWTIADLVTDWNGYVASQHEWQETRYAGLSVLSIDLTGFWRPRLNGWIGKHYHGMIGKAVPAIVLGVMVYSGQVQGKRLPILQAIVRCQPEIREADFRVNLLKAAQKRPQSSSEVKVIDAGFEISEIHAAGLKQFVVRGAANCTARRNHLPEYKGRGCRPKYGEYVRPLSRTYKDKIIAATPPDQTSHFSYDGRRIRVRSWSNLVTSTTKVSDDASTYIIHVYDDPAYKKPLVLFTDLAHLSPEMVYLIYRDRWPVEHPPLAAKQMIGLHRQFVFGQESRFRLPELALLAGNILSYVAAVLPAIPTGFWDRQPQSTPGRLRRFLAQVDFPDLAGLGLEIRKKNSVSDHLPLGIEGHRRQKQPT